MRTNMRKLNLPIIKGLLPAAKWLTMDEYVRFVNFQYPHNRKAHRAWEKKAAVNVPFTLK
jgi:hypothetical protein